MAHTVEEIRNIVANLGRQYGAERIYLFGSCAHGEMGENIDIDLRIDKGEIRGLALAGLLVDLEDALRLPVDLITTDSLDSSFLKAIQEEEVLLYEAS